jgi:DNA-binding XRE family transcriptional regulator
VGNSDIISSQHNFKGKSAVPWNDFREPWRSIGMEYARACAAIAAGIAPPNPPTSHTIDGAALKTSRIARGLSQKALALLAGCSPRTIRRVEAGYGLHRSGLAARLRLALQE